MHLIYRTKKHNLPIVHDSKLAPYMTPVHNHHSPNNVAQKKSIQIILEKHTAHINPNSQTLGCYKPQRKTLYKASKPKKADSGYLKVMGKSEYGQAKGIMNRNKSIQIVERTQSIRRRGQSQYAPYILNNRKNGSSTKLKPQVNSGESDQRDWICARLIQKEVYSVDESSDFN